MEPKIISLNINDILPNRFQPRIAFDEDKLTELSESIKKYGVIQPITVRQIGNKYEIIAGERRYKASLMAGLEKIPAIIQNFSDEISSEVALIENVQREDLTAIEEAISYKKILDMGMITQEKLADKLGISQPAIANKLRLLQLSEKVQDALMANKISERHARSLLKLKNKVKQEEMLHRIVNERLTVRKTDEEIKKILDEKGEEKVKDFIPSPEEIEILDIINSFKVNNKKEEKKVDPMNQFNIPSIDIENDVKENNIVQPTSIENGQIENLNNQNSNVEAEIRDINQTIDNSTSNINPGFMDIDKIQKEAIDIAPKEEVKTVDLLKQMNSNQNKAENEVQIPHGKFFDVMPSMKNRMEEEVQSENTASVNNNSNSNIFNNDSIFSNVNFIPTENSNDSSLQNKVESNNNESILFSNSVSQLQTDNSLLNGAQQMTGIEEPVMPSSNINAAVTEIPSVAENVNVTPVFKNDNIQDLNSNNNISSIKTEIVKEPHLETINTSSLPNESDTNTNSFITRPLSFNMREAIQIVRNTTDRLERLGHQVDSEEMDLKDRYEIKITLYK